MILTLSETGQYSTFLLKDTKGQIYFGKVWIIQAERKIEGSSQNSQLYTYSFDLRLGLDFSASHKNFGHVFQC